MSRSDIGRGKSLEMSACRICGQLRKVPYRVTEENGMIATRRGRPWRSQHDCLNFGAAAPRTRRLRKPRPPVKPAELVYGVDERPPPFMLWMAALQHVLIATTVGMFFPLLVLDAAQASHETDPARDVGLHAGARHRHHSALPECARPRLRLSHAGFVFRRLLFGQHPRGEAGRPPSGRRHDHVRGPGPAAAQPLRSSAARLSADRDRRLRHADERLHARGGRLQPDHRRLGRGRHHEGRDGRAGAARRRLRRA